MRGFSDRAVLSWLLLTGAVALLLSLWAPDNLMWASVTVAVPRWTLLCWVPLLATKGWPVLFGLVGLLGIGVPDLGGPTVPHAQSVRAVAANLQAYADPSSALDAMLTETRADVLITIEEREGGVSGMVEAARWNDRPKASYGMGVWCRGACQAEILGPFGGGDRGMPLATVYLENVCVLGVHVPPPFPGPADAAISPHESQHAYLEAMRAPLGDKGALEQDFGACPAGAEVIWIGDFNASPGTDFFGAVEDSGLSDLLAWPRTHAGTWPNGGGFPNIAVLRLDHAFASPALNARAGLRRIPGSDHRAVVVDWMR